MEDDGTMSCDRQIINNEEYTEVCEFTNIYNAPKLTPRGEIRKNNTPTSDMEKKKTPNGGETRTGDITPLDILATLMLGAFIMFLYLRYRRRIS